MSQVGRRSQRLQATDFSIARILAVDDQPGSAGSSSSSASSSNVYYEEKLENSVEKSPILNCPCCPVPVIVSNELERTSLESISKERAEPGVNSKSNINEALDTPGSSSGISPPNSVCEKAKNPTAVSHDGNDLPWLHCTRYRPPRLPKRSSAGKISKRRPGKHPRIPFTAFQLQVLEDKYSKGAYLARRDVIQLSLILRLPQSRVKIWFQNRRARERRESVQSINELATNSDKDVDTT